MNLSILNFSDVTDIRELWSRIVNGSEDAWFWHTYQNYLFNLKASEQYAGKNLSFIVCNGGEPVGLAPMIVQSTTLDDVKYSDTAYYGGSMPWPCFLPLGKDLPEVEDFVFNEIDRRALEYQAVRIRLRFSPKESKTSDRERFQRIVLSKRYTDVSYRSHNIHLSDKTLSEVRERYRRYVKKFGPSFELAIVDGERFTPELEETYFQLHVKDAGGQFRSRESYKFQSDLARVGEAFYVVARHKESNQIVGMLFINYFKQAAYDGSVGVDPAYQEQYVSHLLKWTAIEELLRRGAPSYELGECAELPTLLKQPSQKNRGISNFKDGWCGGERKIVLAAEKFLSAEYLEKYLAAQAQIAKNYFFPTSVDS